MSVVDAFKNNPAIDHEMWVALVGSVCGLHRPVGITPDTFSGSVQIDKIYGFDATDVSGTAYSVNRTRRDASIDGMDDYCATFQLAGQSTLLQNDRITNLAVGDAVLVDTARPATWISENRRGRWFGVRLPRQSLITHMGFEPEGGLYARGGTAPARLLLRTILEAMAERDASIAPAEPYMQLAIYDLVGAMFAATDLPSVSTYSDKLFGRVCAVIKDCFADPDIGPSEVAAKVGISLRYLQKLFAARGSTFSGHVYSLRLDHAARLLQRRALVKGSQPLGEIAHASGFRDYAYFARSFRRRFACSPGAMGLEATGLEGMNSEAMGSETMGLEDVGSEAMGLEAMGFGSHEIRKPRNLELVPKIVRSGDEVRARLDKHDPSSDGSISHGTRW